ncbi:glycosyltransferase [Myxococcus stipitatus]|uniref:glycosyltransferase family 4 protein n=1 Tax=Myxococcus stipitatus TaxID=83455 RepID=UPI001F215A4A|nr:glycosyltransferase family 4 protein [Myxococcus stipitatus]MCE9667263.1 glycosyltransferase [Myxococcus stipitatus]
MSDLPRLLLCSFDVIPGPSGSSRRLTEYLKALPDRFSVVVLSAKTPDHSHIEKYQGARLLRVPVGSGDLASRIQSFERAVRRQLESEDYALAHFTDPFGGYALCELKGDYGYRLIYEAQTFPSQELRYTHPQTEGDRRFLSKVRRQELFCLMNADLIVTGSQTTRGYIQSLGASEELIRVVRAPVDLKPFEPDVLGAPDGDPFRLMYLGSHVGWQGLPTLLRAVALASEQVDVRLTLVGAQHPDWQPHLDDLVKDLGLKERVEFQAPVHHDDVAKVLALADAGVLALDDVERNRLQGGPLAKVSEYFAAGRPVIAADLPVTRELLPEDAAVFFPPGDSRAMAERIIELAKDIPQRVALGRRARAHAEASLDAGVIRGQLLDLYDSLLEKRVGPVPSTSEDDLPAPTMVTGTPTSRLATLAPPDSGRVRIPQPEKRDVPVEKAPAPAPVDDAPVVMGTALDDGFDTRLVKTEPDSRPVEMPVVMGLPLRERAPRAATPSASAPSESPEKEASSVEGAQGVVVGTPIAIGADPTPVTPMRAASEGDSADDARGDVSAKDRAPGSTEDEAPDARHPAPALGDEPPPPTPVAPRHGRSQDSTSGEEEERHADAPSSEGVEARAEEDDAASRDVVEEPAPSTPATKTASALRHDESPAPGAWTPAQVPLDEAPAPTPVDKTPAAGKVDEADSAREEFSSPTPVVKVPAPLPLDEPPSPTPIIKGPASLMKGDEPPSSPPVKGTASEMKGDEPPSPPPIIKGPASLMRGDEPPSPTPIIKIPVSLTSEEPPSPTPVVRAPAPLPLDEPPSPTPIIKAPASLTRDDALTPQTSVKVPPPPSRESTTSSRMNGASSHDEAPAPTPIVPARSILASRSTTSRVETPSRRMAPLTTPAKGSPSAVESDRPSGRSNSSGTDAERHSGRSGNGASEADRPSGRTHSVGTDPERHSSRLSASGTESDRPSGRTHSVGTESLRPSTSSTESGRASTGNDSERGVSGSRPALEGERLPPIIRPNAPPEHARVTASRSSTTESERSPPVLTRHMGTTERNTSVRGDTSDADRVPPILRPNNAVSEAERPPALPPRAATPPPVPRQRPPRLQSIDGPPRLEPVGDVTPRSGIPPRDPEDEPEEISEDEAHAIDEPEEGSPTPPHSRPRLDEPDEISSDEVEDAELSVSGAARLIDEDELQEAEADEATGDAAPEEDGPAPEPLASTLNPWFAQLAHGYCPPEGTRFARHTPPTTFPGRDEDTDPSRLQPSTRQHGTVRGKGS